MISFYTLIHNELAAVPGIVKVAQVKTGII